MLRLILFFFVTDEGSITRVYDILELFSEHSQTFKPRYNILDLYFWHFQTFKSHLHSIK